MKRPEFPSSRQPHPEHRSFTRIRVHPDFPPHPLDRSRHDFEFIDGWDPDAFDLDTTGFDHDLLGGSFSLTVSGNNLNLEYSPAVPEPLAIDLFAGASLASSPPSAGVLRN